MLCTMPSARTPASLRALAAVFLLVPYTSVLDAKPLSNREILVLYNKSDPESARLAEAYQDARGIPPSQILGLEMPVKQDITRNEYEDTIATPLRETFDEKGWWKRARDPQGLLLPTENRIRAIVLMRGVPLRIKPTPVPKPPNG